MSGSSVALVQATPVLFDKADTLQKVRYWMEKCAERGASLAVFPEAFIPAYPRGFSFQSPVGDRKPQGRALWQKYWDESVDLPGPELESLQTWCKAFGMYLVLGLVERTRGSLYCSMVYIDDQGNYLGKHRKLKPTGAERIIWGEGGGEDLVSFATPFGRLGGLICWENRMPLARMALYEQGVTLYVAPTADQRDVWFHTLHHIAAEGRCYVFGVNQFVRKSDYPDDLPGIEELKSWPDILCRGGSCAIDPMGQLIAGPLWDEEGILIVEVDQDLVTRSRMDFDPAGHYNRPDVFEFRVKK